MAVPVFVQAVSAGDSSGSSVASISVGATIGSQSVVVAFTKHESGVTTITTSDGTSTFLNGNYQNNPGSNSHGQFGYLLLGNAGSKTFQSAFGANRDFPSIIVMEYSFTGFQMLLDDQKSASGTSTAPNSGNLSCTGQEGVAFGGYAEISTNTTSSEQINGVAADGATRNPGSNFTSMWRKTYNAPFTGAASGTLGSSVAWACCGLALKVDSGPVDKGTILKRTLRPRLFGPGLAR